MLPLLTTRSFSKTSRSGRAGTPLASGNIVDDSSATSTINGSTKGSTNWGTLTEVVGAASKLVITQEPSATATAGTAFGTQPIVTEEDQFGNVVTTDSTHTVTAATGMRER